MYRLFCYVREDDCNRAFEVKIGREESVAALRKAIKEKKKPEFDHIPADSLVLWDVKIPLDENLKEAVDKLGLVDKKSLAPFITLSNVVPHQPIDGHLHIVVDRPPPGELYLLAALKYFHEFHSHQPVLFPS